MKSARSLVLIADRSGTLLSAATRITKFPFGRTSSALTLELRPAALPSKRSRHEHDVVPSPNDVGSQTRMSSSFTGTPPMVPVLPIESAIDGSWAVAVEVHATVARTRVATAATWRRRRAGAKRVMASSCPGVTAIRSGLWLRRRSARCQCECRGAAPERGRESPPRGAGRAGARADRQGGGIRSTTPFVPSVTKSSTRVATDPALPTLPGSHCSGASARAKAWLYLRSTLVRQFGSTLVLC